MARQYYYRIVTPSSVGPSHMNWSQKDAIRAAKSAVAAGATSACVERARKWARGYRAEWEVVGCASWRKKKRSR